MGGGSRHGKDVTNAIGDGDPSHPIATPPKAVHPKRSERCESSDPEEFGQERTGRGLRVSHHKPHDKRDRVNGREADRENYSPRKLR
jgi:hypothetical protein